MSVIVPAIIPSSAQVLIELLPKLRFASEIQIDVVDGVFVANKSWPYEPSGSPQEVKSVTDPFTLEVDLMVKQPTIAGKAWEEAGADILVFHIESIDIANFELFVERSKVTIAVCADNDTPLEDLWPYAQLADAVQVMGIAQIGSQGQPFDERVLERIEKIKEQFPQLPITVDGSVSEETILRLKEAGADRFVSGSAIIEANDREVAYNKLNSIVTNN
jgi:ribulose-phosphate 3-epimerase